MCTCPLVYVAAYAPDEGESVFDAVAGFPNPPGIAHLIPDYRQGFVRVDPAGYPQFFMQDVTPVEARALTVTQKAAAEAAFSTKLGQPAWRTLPSWYLVSEDDIAYIEWGTRIALANSQPGATPPPAAPVPR